MIAVSVTTAMNETTVTTATIATIAVTAMIESRQEKDASTSEIAIFGWQTWIAREEICAIFSTAKTSEERSRMQWKDSSSTKATVHRAENEKENVGGVKIGNDSLKFYGIL